MPTDNDDVRWLYGKLKSKGYDIGSEEEFSSSLSNDEDRQWYYDKAKKMGLNVGDKADFDELFKPKTAQQPKTDTVTATPVTGQPATAGQPKAEEKPKGTPMTERERMAASAWAWQLGNQSANATRRVNQNVRDMERYAKSPDAFMGKSKNLGKRYDEDTGEMADTYVTPTGQETSDKRLADEAAHEYRVRRGFLDRMHGNGLDEKDPDDVAKQAQLDQERPMREVLDDVWAEAEDKDRQAQERWREGMRNTRGALFGMSTSAGAAYAGRGEDFGNDYDYQKARHEAYDFDRMVDEMRSRLPEDYVSETLARYEDYFRKNPDAAGGKTARKAAEEALDGDLYRHVYERAVKKEMPKGRLDFLIKKITDLPAVSSSMAASTAAAWSTGSHGLELAKAGAMEEYGKKHKVLDIAGTVANMALDPVTYASGGVGSFAGRTAAGAIGKATLRKASLPVAGRFAAGTLAGRIGQGMAAGAANFATFNTIKGIQQQIEMGGAIDPDTGKPTGFSAGEVLKSTGHGVLLGSATGTLSPIIGNFADKAVRATSSTAGKVGVRLGETAVSALAEGTVFSIPEWMEGDADAMDVWTDNLAMMLGFKASHGVKSVPKVLDAMRTDGKRVGKGFKEKLRDMMDASPADTAFTSEDMGELRDKGYDDMAALFEDASKRKRANGKAAEKTGTETRDGESNLPVKYEYDGYEDITEPDGWDGYETMKRLMADNSVSEAVRAKAYYVLTGRRVPMGSVMGYATEEGEDGSLVVNSVNSGGGVVTSRKFAPGDKGRKQADEEIGKIKRQAELNTVTVGERYRETTANRKAMEAAVRDVFPDADMDAILRDYQLVKSGQETGEEYVSRARLIDESLERNRGVADDERPLAIRQRINAGRGVDIDKALSKPIADRSEAEREAVEEYARALYPEGENHGGEPDQMAKRFLERRQEAADEGKEAFEAADGEEPDTADADAIRIRMNEARQGVDDAFGDEAEMVMSALDDDPWSVLLDDALTPDRQEAAAYYFNSKAAMDAFVEAAEGKAADRKAEAEREVSMRTNRQSGRVLPATLKVDDRKVHVISGDVRVFPDGTGVDAGNSSESVIIRDQETGEVRFILPDMILSLGQEMTPEEELASAYEEIEARREAVVGERPAEEQPTEEQHAEEQPTATKEGIDRAYRRSLFPGETIQRGSELGDAMAGLNEYNQARFEREQEEKADADRKRRELESTALYRVPKDGNGMPLLEETDPDTAWDAAVEFMENEDDATEYVKSMVDATKKAVEKARKDVEKVKPQGDIARFKADKAAARQALADAEERQAKWEAMAAVKPKRTFDRQAQELARRAEAERRGREKALAEKEEQKKLEAQRKAEQEETGTHAVNPRIRKKWDDAKKEGGNADVVTLPDGSQLRGHYVLTEAGVATASHDVGDAYRPTEGFPVDENGQSVNDRDYERDQQAQGMVRSMAQRYDSRALQSPVIVSKDGVVLSGNNRTMSGDIAARDGTDKAYNDYLGEFSQKYGFTREQVSGMEHPRVLFVPDEDLPYDAATFARFNAQDMKTQGKPEAAVKLGKVVPDDTFSRVANLISGYDRLSDFYANQGDANEALKELMAAGVINDKQLPELRTGNSLSAAGKELIENTLIGKVFQSNPDAVRQVIANPGLRQGVVMGLSEIAHNRTLEEGGYGLGDALARAVDLVARAKASDPDLFKEGVPVSPFGRQQGLFDDEHGESAVTDATTLLLADILNSKRPSDLRRVLATYNKEAADAANGQLDMFSGGDGEVKTREELLSEINNLYVKANAREQKAIVDAAIEDRKRRARKDDGDKGTEPVETPEEGGGQPGEPGDARGDARGQVDLEQAKERVSGKLSDEINEFGKPYVKSSKGSIDYGMIGPESGLQGAPIRLSLGENNVDADGKSHGYGLLHIEAGHGEQIRGAGYDSVEDFVEKVARDYVDIREGGKVDGKQTYLLEIPDDRNDTLFVQLSHDGKYWNVNSAGIFRRKYSRRKPKVFTVPAFGPGTDTDTSGVNRDHSKGVTATSGDSPQTFSAGKDTEKSSSAQGNKEKKDVVAEVVAAEAETDTNPTEAQKKAGNYKKGHVKVDGHEVTIENPKGSTRSGRDANGKEWSVRMNNTYGYIRGTEGVDGDHIDVFLSDKPEEGDVWVIDQVDPKIGAFDEHKVMYGFSSEDEARKAYLSNYSPGWKGLGAITHVSKDEFKKWIDSSHRKTKPFAEYKSVRPAEEASGENHDLVWDRKNKRTSAVLDSVERFVTRVKEHPDERERLGRDMDESIKALGDLELDLMIRDDKVLERYPGLVDLLAFERRERNEAAAAAETNKSNVQYVDGLLESQVLEPGVYKPKKFDITGYASKDKNRSVMNGVHHGDGYAVVSDGYILVADKQSYDRKLEGKTVDNKGKEIKGKFPDWKRVLPKDTVKVTNGESVVAMRLNTIWERVTAEWKAAKARGEKVGKLMDFAADAHVFLRTPDGFVPMKLGTLTRFVDASERLGNHDLLLDKKKGFVMSEGRNGYALGMPFVVDGNLGGDGAPANMRFAIDLRGGKEESTVVREPSAGYSAATEFKDSKGNAYSHVGTLPKLEEGEGIARDPSALDKEENDIIADTKERGAMSREQRVAYEAVREMLGNSGVEVTELSEDAMDALADMSGGVLSRGKKRAPETDSIPQEELQHTAIPSADGAKILKNLDTLAKSYEEKEKNHPRTFVGEVADALGIARNGASSKYASFETKNGQTVVIRLSNHNAKVSNFDNAGEEEGISIVISPKKSAGINNDGNAHVVEFYYDAIKLRRSEEKPLAEIARSIQHVLYSGEYKDTTGLAVRQEVNPAEAAQLMTVYHGSGADFDEFDHSHMSEGEGQQMFGWGSYVTQVKNIGRAYAKSAGEKHGGMVRYKGREMPILGKARHDDDPELRAARIVAGYMNLHRLSATEAKEVALNSPDNSAFREDIEAIDVDAIEIGKPRHLYTVDIPEDTGENYLAWDDRADRLTDRLGISDEEYEANDMASGRDVYEHLTRELGSDKAASEYLAKRGFAGVSYPANYTRGGDTEGRKNYVIFNEKDLRITGHVKWLKDRRGVVYGGTVGGKIYLNGERLNPESPIHEYTHIWDSACKEKNPELWKRGVELLRQTPLWEQVRNDPNYADIKDDEDRVASEVHSRLTGKDGAAILEKMANGNTPKRVIAKLRQWLRDFWWWCKDTFSPWTREEAERVSMDDFINMPLKDLARGRELRGENIADEDTRFFMGKKAREQYEETLRKRDVPEEWIKEGLDYLHSLEDTKDNGKKIKVAVKWLGDGAIRLPEDMEKVDQALSVATKAKVDPMRYKSPMELMEAHANFKPTRKRIDPDTVSTLKNKKEYGDGIVVYDVEESEESRKNMREIINTHFGEDASPWCLLQGDGNGNLTKDSKRYWEHYDAYPKRVAFQDGKLLAFCANDSKETAWWDRQDSARNGIPVTRKMPNDELGRTATYAYIIDEDAGGHYENPTDIHRGNKQNGLYEAWDGNGKLKERSNYKDGKLEGLRETWHENGKMEERSNYKDGKLEGLYEAWHENGKLWIRFNYKDGKRDGLYETWYGNGQLRERSNFKDGKLDGLFEAWHENGKLKERGFYISDTQVSENEWRRHAAEEEEGDIVAEAKRNGTYMKAPNGEPTRLTGKQWAQVRTKAFKEWFGDWENGNSSKVVDENGEPLVVYHGSSWDPMGEKPGDAVFRHDKVRNTSEGVGFYFTPDKDAAQGFGDKSRAYFLNLRNPVNAYDRISVLSEDEYHDAIEEGGEEGLRQATREKLRGKVDEVLDDLRGKGWEFYPQVGKELVEPLVDEASTVESVLDYLADASSYVTSEDFDGERFQTDLRLAEAKAFGIDGYHSPGYGGGSGAYVAFSPNQIKSATDNVGTFDAENDDIRFRFAGEEAREVEAVNERFNEKLDGMREENADKTVLSLGRPSAVLRAAGVEDKEMKLYGSKVARKAKKHGFAIGELRNLPSAVANPVAVFDNIGRVGNRSILTELRTAQGNFLVTVDIGKGMDVDFNIISSIFGKNDNSVAGWINKGYATYINKEKALGYLHLAAPIAAASGKRELDSVAKIINDFENPAIDGRENSLNGENLTYHEDGTDPKEMESRAMEIGKELGVDINIVSSGEDMAALPDARRRDAKGWTSVLTGEVTIVVPNHSDVADIENTVFHEVVAHKGLRELVGKENMDGMLDEVYGHAEGKIREDIDRKTERVLASEARRIQGLMDADPGRAESRKGVFSRAEATAIAQGQRERLRREATEEYMADLAGRIGKEGFEKMDVEELSFWQKVRDRVMRLLRNLLSGKRWGKGVRITDKDISYIIYRSWKNLKEKGKATVLDAAEDAVMRFRTGYGSVGERPTWKERRVTLADAKADHGFRNYSDARAWARENIARTYSDAETRGKGEIRVSGAAIDKYLSEKSVNKSASRDVHMSVLRVLPDVLGKSLDIEQHADRMKGADGVRGEENGINRNVLIHRLYGGVRMDDGNVYRVKITLKEDRTNAEPKKAYSYEATKIELLAGLDEEAVTSSRYANNSILVANLLRNVESDKEKGKKITDILENEDEAMMFRDGDMSLDDAIAAMKAKAAADNEASLAKRVDAMESIGGNLSKLRSAMARQREYDKETVRSLANLATTMMDNGMLDSLSGYETKRILSVIKGGVGKNDTSRDVRKLMGIMVDNQLRTGADLLGRLLRTRGSKVDGKGVERIGELDIAGQSLVKATRKYMSFPKSSIDDTLIPDLLDRMGASDKAVADNAAIEYQAALMGRRYVEEITESKAEEKSLKDEIRQAKEDREAGRMTAQAYGEFVKATEDAIAELRIGRAQSFAGIARELGGELGESRERAKVWREREKDRVNEIRHNCNSDMEGRPSDEHHKETKAQKLMNNSVVRLLLAPLGTLDMMLRMIGSKNARGEGYLWNRIMPGWVRATESEYAGYRDGVAELDRKAAEIFGGKTRFGDIIRKERKMPGMSVEFWDGGEMRPHELTQGNMMYVYMADKMTDGKMKLRKMGITEDDVAAIKENLDDRLIQLADWLQEDFLPRRRERYNAVHERMFGAPMAAIDDYFPLRILENSLEREEDVAMDDNAAIALGGTVTGAIKTRVRNSRPLDVLGADALNVTLDHLREMEHWAAFAELTRDINTMLSYKRFRNQVMNMTSAYGSGATLWKNFRDACKLAVGAYRPPSATADKLAVNVAKGVTAAKVSLRVFTALKQFLSFPAYLADCDIRHLAANTVNPKGAWKWAMENLPVIEKRWKSRVAGDPRLLKTDMDWKAWRTRTVELASRVGMSPNAFVDALTVSIGARSIYQTNYEKYRRWGFDEETADRKARDRATILVNETQQSSEGPFLSAMQADRSWLSTMLTVFRNSSMGYTRQAYDALRNEARLFSPGYRERATEFMAKQLVRDGLTEEQARNAAREELRKGPLRNFARAAIFWCGLQALWNLGKYLPYLFMGDDDDKKEEMMVDAARQSLFGGLEGLSGGNLVSTFLNKTVTGETISRYDLVEMPIMSDITDIIEKWPQDKLEALNDVANVAVQASVGVNPQTATDIVVAVLDACGDDADTARECAMLMSRVINCPQSQIDQVYFDELDATGEEASGMTPAQMARRYARYKRMRQAPLTGWARGEEGDRKAEERYMKKAVAKEKEIFEKDTDGSEAEALSRWRDEYESTKARVSELNKVLDDKDASKEDYGMAKEEFSGLVKSPAYKRYGIMRRYDKDISDLTREWLSAEDTDAMARVARAMRELKERMVKKLRETEQQ